MSEPTSEEIEAEVAAWVAENWDPDLEVGEWWQRLADARYAAPMLPEAAGGRGWSRSASFAVTRALAAADALGPPTGLGMMLAAPTIAAHGSPEQIDRLVTPILTGQHAWCQLFSEPNAGSDLAGLQTKAEKDGDEWIVNGQKVWTSGGQVADMGMLIARTSPDAPKHQGISYFAFPMGQDGVDIRPLREMTGRALFNEVFIDEGRAADADLIGGLGNGWRVANSTLMFERASLGASGVAIASTTPGTIAGNLTKRAGDLTARRGGEQGVPRVGADLVMWLGGLATKLGRETDPVLRDELTKLYVLTQVNKFNMLRAKAGTGITGGEGNLAKLAMSELYRRFREVGNQVVGADGMLAQGASAHTGVVQELTMFSPGPSIYGGTDEVQRNILGERILGLPKEPGPAKETPFNELPSN